MALPRRQSQDNEESNSPQTYQYTTSRIRNASKTERIGLNTDFQYIKDLDENISDSRLLSSSNPALRNRKDASVAKEKTVEETKHHQSKLSEAKRLASKTARGARKKFSAIRKPKKLFVRARATTVSWTIVTWGMWLWVAQLIFAFLSIVFLGLIGAGEAAANSSLITRIFGWAVERAIEGTTWFISGTSIGVGDMGAAAFIGCYMIAFAIGLITLIAANTQYMLTFMHPMSGQENGKKYMAFLIALIGYSTPLLNIFPWFLIFVAVVWKYPK